MRSIEKLKLLYFLPPVVFAVVGMAYWLLPNSTKNTKTKVAINQEKALQNDLNYTSQQKAGTGLFSLSKNQIMEEEDKANFLLSSIKKRMLSSRFAQSMAGKKDELEDNKYLPVHTVYSTKLA